MKSPTSTISLLLSLLALAVTSHANDLIEIGQRAPEFELSDQIGQLHSLEDYRDQWVVLYFYPKDQTPGCTTEACEFRDNIFAFKQANAQILGVSFDDAESHQKFAERYNLPFPLLADVEGKAAEAYGVQTKMFGMRFAKRETFLIDPAGVVAKHYKDVDPDGHSLEVLGDLRALDSNRRINAEP
ncbi:MAG: peroxiredoxin [Woeseiaceae bacterium]|jgi:peroxiredoxin Q/BCP